MEPYLKYDPTFGKFMSNKCKCNVAFAGFAVVLAVIIQDYGVDNNEMIKVAGQCSHCAF